MERAPPVLPPGLDLSRPRGREHLEHAQGGGAIRGELDLVPAVCLLESLGRKLEDARARLLEDFERMTDADAYGDTDEGFIRKLRSAFR